MSQQSQILEHLKSGKSITPIEALNKFGSFRLAAYIYTLRMKGHNIDTALIGEQQYAQYSLNA